MQVPAQLVLQLWEEGMCADYPPEWWKLGNRNLNHKRLKDFLLLSLLH